MLLEPSRSFSDLLKLSRLHLSTLPLRPRSRFWRNEIDLRQFKTSLVFEHDACYGSVPLTFDDDKALIRPEPYLEIFRAPVWRRTDFTETELPEKCERVPDSFDELLPRWRFDRFSHWCA